MAGQLGDLPGGELAEACRSREGIGHRRVRLAERNELFLDLVDVQHVVLQRDADDTDSVQRSVPDVPPVARTGHHVDRAGADDRRESSGLDDPAIGKTVGDGQRVERPADDHDLAIQPLDHVDHAVEHGMTKSVFHEHQGDSKRRSGHRAQQPALVFRQVSPGQRDDRSRKHQGCGSRATGRSLGWPGSEEFRGLGAPQL